MNTYDHYIEQEKIYSKTYMNNMQIYDERFDEDEFALVRSVWDDQSMVDRIYYVIDDIIKTLNMNKNVRCLVIGDFLFSLTSTDLIDPADVIFKIDRCLYLSRIRMRAMINTSFKIDYSIYILVHQKLLIGLRLENILERCTIRVKKENMWNTSVYYRLIVKKDFFIQSNTLGMSKKPFVLVNFMDSKYSIGSFRNIWKVKRKKREMDDVKISYAGIKKAGNIGLVLSRKSYDLVKHHLENEKMSLLKKNNCSSFNEYLSKLKKSVMDVQYYKKLSDNDTLFTNFQKIVSFETLSRDIYDKIFYLPCFADNRGRQYYGTIVSPTFHIIFRYLYDFERNNKILQNSLTDSKFYDKIMKYAYLIENGKESHKIYLTIVLYIEIGKHFIKKENIFTKTEDIILLGKKKYIEKNINIKFEDVLYLEKIYNTLDELNNGIIDDIILFKDATASGLQNYGILLDYQIEKLKYLNIDGEDWCDTYQYLINKFLKGDDIYKKRKYWKNTIMTIPYNSTWFSCFTKFIDTLENDNIIYNNLTENERLSLRNMHKDFYYNIKNNLKAEFYIKKSVDAFKVYKYSQWKVVSIEEYKVNYKKFRDKYTNTVFMLIDDEKSSLRAMEANNMHYLDAELVRYVLDKMDTISVHDCFGVRLSEIHLLMDIVNEYYSKLLKKDTYSIHILI